MGMLIAVASLSFFISKDPGAVLQEPVRVGHDSALSEGKSDAGPRFQGRRRTVPMAEADTSANPVP
jgi:hypothetical protein